MGRQPLTERQQEILALVEQDKTPDQIAKRLKLTPNAVYAHITRIRERGHLAPRAGRKRTRTRRATTARGRSRPAARRTTRRAPRANRPRVTSRGNSATPLQAVAFRRTQIEDKLRQVEAKEQEASRLATLAGEQLAKLQLEVNDELRGLSEAEEALRSINNRPGRRPRQQQTRATGRRRGARQTAQKRRRARKPQATEVAA